MTGISMDERRELLRSIKDADENYNKGMYALAEPAYRKGVEVLGDGSPEISGCLKNLAHICVERKDYGEALKLEIHLLILNEERFGEDHPKTIALMDEIAGLYEKLGRADESRDMYERARKSSERSLWADQEHEPEPVEGVPNPAQVAAELDLDYQYSETAKMALESSLPKPGEVAYEFGQEPAAQKKRDLSEETMKLPKVVDPVPPVKDPQLETLILNKLDMVPPKVNEGGNGQSDTEHSADQAASETPAETPGEPTSSPAETTQAEPPTILTIPQPKISSPETSTSPSTITGDKGDRKKSDEILAKIVLGGSLKQQAKEKASPDPAKMVGRSSLQERLEMERQEAARAAELAAQNRKGFEAKLFKSDKQRNLILGTLLGCFWVLLLTSVFTSRNNTQEDYRSIPHRYRTADGEKLFFLPSANECEFVAGSETARMPYFQNHGDLPDTFRVMFGPLLHHQYWLTKIKNGIIDDQGSTLYTEASPELQVADFADELGRAAQLTYLRQHHYPKKLEDLDGTKRAYHNPFTGQADHPTIQTVVVGKKSQSDDGQQRKRLYDIAVNGGRWPHEPKRHQGEISCYSAVIHTKKGDLNTFYIRCYDRDVKPLGGSQPNSAFAVVLENGVVKASPRPHLAFSGKSFIRARRAWLMNEINPSMLFILKYGAAIVFMLLAAAAWVLSASRKTKKASLILKVIMFSSVLIAAVYLLADLIP